MIAELGLIILCLGWMSQLIYSWSGKKEIKKKFIALYVVGVLLLVIDGYRAGLNTLAALNLISLAIAAIVLLRVKK